MFDSNSVYNPMMILGGVPSGNPTSKPSEPTVYDADAQAYFTAVETSKGSAMDGVYKDALNQLVIDLKAAGAWVLMDRIFIFRNESVEAAQICLKSLSIVTENDAPAWTTAGYTGDGVADWIDLGFAPTDGGNFSQNDASWIIKSPDLSSEGRHGCTDNTIRKWESGTGIAAKLNCAGEIIDAGGVEFGMIHVDRSSSASQQLFINGALSDSENDPSVTMESASFAILCENQGGTVQVVFSSATVELAIIGASLNEEAAGVFQSVDDYLTAITP